MIKPGKHWREKKETEFPIGKLYQGDIFNVKTNCNQYAIGIALSHPRNHVGNRAKFLILMEENTVMYVGTTDAYAIDWPVNKIGSMRDFALINKSEGDENGQ